MELVLPQTFEYLSDDAMLQLDGGDAYRFVRNMTGLIVAVPALRRALQKIGVNTARLRPALAMGYSLAFAKYGTAATIAGGIIAGLAVGTAFYMLWNVRMFY